MLTLTSGSLHRFVLFSYYLPLLIHTLACVLDSEQRQLRQVCYLLLLVKLVSAACGISIYCYSSKVLAIDTQDIRRKGRRSAVTAYVLLLSCKGEQPSNVLTAELTRAGYPAL